MTTIVLSIAMVGVISCSHEDGNYADKAGVMAVKQKPTELMQKWCADCHIPPHSSDHTPAEWPSIVLRMQHHRVENGMAKIPDTQMEQIITYLQCPVSRPLPLPELCKVLHFLISLVHHK